MERGDEHDADGRVPRRRPPRGDRSPRAHHRHGGRRARHRSGRDPQAELHPARATSRSRRSPAPTTTSVSTPRRSTRRAASPATTSCAPSRRRGASAATSKHARHRRVARTSRSRPVGCSRSSAAVEVARRRHRRRDGRHVRARAGSRDGVRDDRRRAARCPDGGRAPRPVRHRGRAARHRHDGLALAADRGQRAVQGERGGARARRSSSPAHLLEASPDDIVLHEGGKLGVAGVSGEPRSVGRARVGRGRSDPPARRLAREPRSPRELDFNQGEATYPFGAHIAVVEVDTRDRARRADPARRGRRLRADPQPAARRAASSTAASRRASRRRSTRASSTTTTATRSPATSWTTRCRARPSSRASTRSNTETPTPRNPLGAKGIGESGTIGSTPAVQNAVVDAVSHLGIRHIDMPLTAERVWRAIQDAAAG